MIPAVRDTVFSACTETDIVADRPAPFVAMRVYSVERLTVTPGVVTPDRMPVTVVPVSSTMFAMAALKKAVKLVVLFLGTVVRLAAKAAMVGGLNDVRDTVLVAAASPAGRGTVTVKLRRSEEHTSE